MKIFNVIKIKNPHEGRNPKEVGEKRYINGLAPEPILCLNPEGGGVNKFMISEENKESSGILRNPQE